MLIGKDHELADQTNKTDRKPGNLNPFAVSTMKGANPPSAWDQLKDHYVFLTALNATECS